MVTHKLGVCEQADMGGVGSSIKELRGTMAAQKCWPYGRPCGLLGSCSTSLDPRLCAGAADFSTATERGDLHLHLMLILLATIIGKSTNYFTLHGTEISFFRYNVIIIICESYKTAP